MNEATDEFDVLIVGGGPAGASLSVHLAQRGIGRVLLIEARVFPRPKLCGEFISPECLVHFARLGVREGMLNAGGTSVAETVFYSSGGRALHIPSSWFGGGRSYALGLSRAEMDARLLERARRAGVCVVEEAQCTGLVIEEGKVSGALVKTKDGVQTFRARVIVDATGRARAASRWVGDAAKHNGSWSGERSPHKPRQRASLVAFKAHLEATRVAEGTCEIYFYRGGYGGLSSVENGLSNLCFIVQARDVRERGSNAERVMREVVMSNSRAARALEGARIISPWLSVALESFGKSEVTPAPGLITVGDAAAFIDPFTGSGMLMALESGELAATCIARSLNESDEPKAMLDALARDYRRRYSEKFGARLRVCAQLRRAAFAPEKLIDAGIAALNLSMRARRHVARITRRAMQHAET